MKISNSDTSAALQRLHPLSLLFFAARTVKEGVHALPFIPLIILLISFIYGDNVSWITVSSIVIGVVLCIVFTFGFMCWYRFKYALEKESLYIEQGVLFRKKTWLPKKRVLSIDSTASLYLRPLGLVNLKLSTAGANGMATELSAISRAQAELIRDALKLSPGETREAQATDTQNKLTISFGDLLNYSVTSGRMGLILAVFGAIISRFDDVRSVFDIWKFISYELGTLWFVWFSIIVLALAWIVTIILSILIDYKFRLERSGDKLLINKGLLDKKSITVPLNRIQAVHIVGNLFRRPFGLVGIRIVVAGMTDAEARSMILFPLLKASKLDDFLDRFVPGYVMPQQWSERPNPSARSQFMMLPTLLGSLFIVPGIIWLQGYYWLLTLLLPIFAVFWGHLRYNQAAWVVQEGQIAIRYGGFTVHKAIVSKKRMQWYRVLQTVFQEKKGNATLKIAVAAGKEPAVFKVRHAPEAKVEEITKWLTTK
ncbi:PH domain-containing protein [Paenibacillus sp. L3-i20]|uniref:PH domain-containing protein n=1 Tax=Paenibacillus sp. L3-i20 TaxID=2905833 RepID=UPI001EE0672D|nr:PH domain-containing protein [Paenibacillus sp. L3-i20]GKU77318.1 membrane protein [Paenibacillus sp. L3-i20]